MAYIRIIDEDEATGLLKKEYEAAVRRAGKVFNVIKIQGLRPVMLNRGVSLYKAIMYGPSALTRAERELLAVAVSQFNDCHY